MSKSQAEKLGAIVRKGRLAHGYSMRSLAEAVEVDFSTISYLERGAIERPRVEMLWRLSDALDLPLDELYRLAGYALEGLPELRVYLRTKYPQLTAAETAELDEHFRRLRDKPKTKKRRKP